MGVEPLIALPPRVLVAGRLQCGAARAGVRRGHGECAELAHLARGYKASYLRLDMLKTGRYLVRLGKIRFSHSDGFWFPKAAIFFRCASLKAS